MALRVPEILTACIPEILAGRRPQSVWGLVDEIAYAQLCRQLREPVPEPGPDANEVERWLARDLDWSEGIEKFHQVGLGSRWHDTQERRGAVLEGMGRSAADLQDLIGAEGLAE